MSTPIEQSIHKTVAWFSLFETPVTVFELWKWMLACHQKPSLGRRMEPDRTYSLEETFAALDGEWLRERLVEADGLWTTRSSVSSTTASERRTRFLDAARKFKKLRRAMRFVRLVPGVVAVAAGNTLAWWNTRPDSDIDLLVVTRPGTIWLARLLVVAPFALLGKRPAEGGELVEPEAAVDPFCFSFFATTDALDFSALRLEGGDPYLAYWVRSLVPVLDRGGVFDRIVTENGWAREVLPNVDRARRPPLTPPPYEEGERNGWARLSVTPTLDRLAKAIQLRRFPPKIRALMNVDSRVVVNDRTLKFHENDRREEYRERLKNMGN